MIPCDADTLALLNSGHYNVHLLVDVYRPDGSLVELPGHNSITQAFKRGTISAQIDSAARQVSATFEIGKDEASLSPFLGLAEANFPSVGLYPGASLQFNCAITPPGVAPTTEWFFLERAKIDAVDMDTPGEITISGRDWWSAKLLDRWIEHETMYGGTLFGNPISLRQVISGGVATDGVVGHVSLLDEWAGDLAAVLADVDATGTHWPDWNLRVWNQQEAPILEVVRSLALQIGWDIRSFPRWPNFALVLYDPDRERTTPDAILHKGIYTKITKLGVDDGDVRNVIEVFWDNMGDRPVVHREDAASIAQYGRRFMRLSEDQMFGIDTQYEAERLADASLADSKDPYASHTIEAPFWPYVELNDLQRYLANDLYDSDQQFAVVGYTHTIEQGGGTTVIAARGKPLAAYRRYRLGSPRMVHVSTNPSPPDAQPAKDRALWLQVDSTDFLPA